MQILTEHIEAIHRLCRENMVRTLFAFGSVTTDKFTKKSDIDLVVDIEDADPFSYTDKYFKIKFNLIDLLHRDIDLLEEKAINNPYFIKELESTKILIYAF